MSIFVQKALTWGLLVVPYLAHSYERGSATHLLPRQATSPTVGLPPKQDPWYQAPDGFEEAEPGEILRVRVAPPAAAAAVNASAAYNILYRTTDSNYEASWAVTTLYIPATSSPNVTTASSLLSYQYYYDSANLDSSPSYTFQTSPPIDIVEALGYGWYVNVPDYEGPFASFALGLQSGHATLDSIRAVLSSGFGLSKDARYALWGYSGGSLASEWAAELQPQYAPELNISGVAAGGLVPNATSIISTISGGYYVFLVFEALVGLTSQDPVARQYLTESLKPEGPYNATTFFSVENITFSEATTKFALQDPSNYFIDGDSAIFSPELLAVYDSQAIQGYHGVPEAPLFFYKAVADNISVIADTDELVNRYCQVGANILYQRNTVGGHNDESVNGAPRALDFLNSVFAGTWNHTGCTIENVAVNITDTGL